MGHDLPHCVCLGRPLDDSVLASMRLVDETLSMFNNGSTVSKINRGELDVADAHFRTVFLRSRAVCGSCRTAVMTRRWPAMRFMGSSEQRSWSQPSEADVEAALGAVGLGRCSVGSDGKVVRKSADTRFDFFISGQRLRGGLYCRDVRPQRGGSII